MISPRSGGGWATYNGKIYVAGGEVQNERYSAAFRSLETYDPVANRWDILPSLPGAVHGNAVAFIGNKLHTVSGKMEGGGFADAPGKATADHSVMETHAAGTQ
jgi:N-acetylneuraminic acid mutarotase